MIKNAIEQTIHFFCFAVCILFNYKVRFYMLKFINSEKATKFCEIFTFAVCTVVKSMVKISQNFVAFSEYISFKSQAKRVWGPTELLTKTEFSTTECI